MPAGFAIAWDVPLAGRNTFGLEAQARALATVHDAQSIPELLADPQLQGLPLLVLGGGSNVLFATPRFEGCLLHLVGNAARIIEDDPEAALIEVEAGCEWDALVDWTLDHGLQGLENLALIPGQTGAAPIQNIGAYGVEVGTLIDCVHAYDRRTNSFARLERGQCHFGYRDSIFKREPDRWIVTGLNLRLPRHGTPDIGYAGLAEELAAMGNAAATPRNVAAAVRRIRRRKLPDPAIAGNAGSFFKNPIVPQSQAAVLQARFPALPVYRVAREDQRKLSAAWLIEQAGWRGHREGDAGISAQHALVLVNLGHATGAQLLALARRVMASVQDQFGVLLEPEPRIIGGA